MCAVMTVLDIIDMSLVANALVAGTVDEINGATIAHR
jgi:hypothetical protein